MKSFMLLVLATAGFSAAEDIALIAKPIQITVCRPLPEELPQGLKPFGYEQGVKIFYLVEGDGLIGINDDSLNIEYIKDGAGRDISKKRNGKDDFELGSFPEASDDGKYLVFSIEIKSNQFGTAESLNIKGEIKGHSANVKRDLEIPIDMVSKEFQTNGPYSVINSANIPKDSNGMIGDAFAGMMFGNRETTNIGIRGPMKNIISMDVYSGDKKLEKSGNSVDDEKRVYMFDKTSDAKLKVMVSYWDKVDVVSIKIDGGLKK